MEFWSNLLENVYFVIKHQISSEISDVIIVNDFLNLDSARSFAYNSLLNESAPIGVNTFVIYKDYGINDSLGFKGDIQASYFPARSTRDNIEGELVSVQDTDDIYTILKINERTSQEHPDFIYLIAQYLLNDDDDDESDSGDSDSIFDNQESDADNDESDCDSIFDNQESDADDEEGDDDDDRLDNTDDDSIIEMNIDSDESEQNDSGMDID